MTLFRHPYDIAVAADGSLLVADMGAYATPTTRTPDGRIIRVDPVTGRQSLVTSGNLLVDPAGLAIAPNGLIYVIENVGTLGQPAVVSVNPATGAQTLVTQGGQLCYPFGIAVHPNGSVLVTDYGDFSDGTTVINCTYDFGALVKVNPVTTKVQLLSRNAARVGQPLPQPARGDGRAGRADPAREPERRDRAGGGEPGDRGAGRGDHQQHDRPPGPPPAAGAHAGRRRGRERLHPRRHGGRARVRGPAGRRAEHPAPGPPALQQPAWRGRGGEPRPRGGAHGVARQGRRRPAGELRRIGVARPRGAPAALRLGPRRERQLRDGRRAPVQRSRMPTAGPPPSPRACA